MPNPINNISFYDPSPKHPSLENLEDWNNVPSFCIITGQNGIGKSQLLGHISNEIRTQGEHKLLKISSDAEASTKNNTTVIENSSEDTSQFNPTANNGKKLELANGALPLLETVFSRFHEYREQNLREAALPSNETKLSDYYYAQKDELKTSKNFILLKNKDMKNLIARYTEDTFGKDPLEYFNKILESNDFKYRVKFTPGIPVMSATQAQSSSEFFALEEGDLSSPEEPAKGSLDLYIPKKEASAPAKNSSSIKEISVDPKSLSSGEKAIINVLSWQYCGEGYGSADKSKSPIQKADIMILDEPDRHLDPKYNKMFLKILKEEFVARQGIQVIMTTHRLDTVSLAPEGTLFTMHEKDGRKSVSPSHRTLSQLRLAKNVKELSVPIKVYTESFNDAEFYESIHNSLLEKRDEGKFANIDGENKSWPSRRYIPKFNSTAAVSGLDGGLSSTIKHTAKDKASHYHKEQLAPGSAQGIMTSPFGIVDMDGVKEGSTKAQKEIKTMLDGKSGSKNDYNHGSEDERDDLKERLLILERYTLENFLYDPFLLCSVLEKTDLKQIKNENIKTGILACKDSYDNLHPKSDDTAITACTNEFFEFLKTVLQEAKNERNEAAIQQRKEEDNLLRNKAVTKVVSGLCSETGKIKQVTKEAQEIIDRNPDMLLFNNEESFNKILSIEELKGHNLTKENFCDQCKKTYVPKKLSTTTESSSTNDSKTPPKKIKLFFGKFGQSGNATCEYPIEFLQDNISANHILDKVFAGNLGTDGNPTFNKEKILEKLYSSKDICLPGDLLETFHDLDVKMRKQVRNVIKPGASPSVESSSKAQTSVANQASV